MLKNVFSRLTRLFQYYAGDNAHINLESAQPIEKVMIGDIEASIVIVDGTYRHLYWMKNGIVFELISGNDVELDELIAIAKSV